MNNTPYLGMIACTILSGSGCSRPEQAEVKPNIVFILIDDLGWKDVGFMGSEYYETPNIDRLAKGGMIFTQAYANASNSVPARTSLSSCTLHIMQCILQYRPKRRSQPGMQKNHQKIATITPPMPQ